MKIRIFLNENLPLQELPEAEFPMIPRLGEIIRLSNGSEYEVTEVMWRANEYDPAWPTVTVKQNLQ